jgi:tetratricopeptide (TPR) repeat protein
MATSARIDELRNKFDENPRRYFAPLANEYRKAGDFEQAIFICQEYLPQQPGHMSGHIVLGQALFEAKRLPEARTVFETALTLDPENLIALRHLADISRDLGDVAVARGWYERVLQADPRNEEIAAIMSTMGAAKTSPAPAAPTAEVPAAPAADAKPAPASAVAPTMELSAAAVQEMVRARQAAKTEETPKTLDEAPTIELTTATLPEPMEGLEPTAHGGATTSDGGGLLDIPAGGLLDSAADGPATFDIPSGGMLGLEPTSAAPAQEANPNVAHSDGVDTISLEDFSVPKTAAPAAASARTHPPADDGLLDLGSFDVGGVGSRPATPVAPATSTVSAAETPIDGGHEGAIDFDFELPEAPATPAAAAADAPVEPPLAKAPTIDSVPTVVMEAVADAVPAVVDAVQDAVPAIVDMVQEAVPAVVDMVTSAPTVIMNAIRAEPPKPDASKAAPAFVTETMAQLYLEQGHRDQALDIYRQLVASRPNDAELRARVDAVERAGERPKAPPADDPIASAPASQPAAPRQETVRVSQRQFNRAGPSIRDVLRNLLGIDGSASNGTGNGSVASATGEGDVGSIDTLFSATPVADEITSLAAAFDGGYVAPTGSIDEVFAGGAR